MDKAALAEKKIKTLTEKVGASDDGQAWLKQILDPFGDLPRAPVGVPDLISGNSVIQVVKLSTDYTVGSSPEDVHIFMDSVDTQVMLAQNGYIDTPITYPNSIGATAVGGVGTYKRGGVVVRSGPVGSQLTTLNTQGSQCIPLPAVYTQQGSTRVIAKGYEVVNESNKLTVGGSVTVYRDTGSTPYSSADIVNTYKAGNTTYGGAHPRRALTRVPVRSAEATIIPGSQTYEAAKGAYVVPTMCAQTNNPSDNEHTVFTINDPANTTNTLWANIYDGGADLLPKVYDYGNVVSPFFVSGSYFTGLPAGSKLKITAIWYLERFVDATNADLVVMAHPSPFYDPVAMEIYSKTAQRLPHGTSVKNNADGDWIKSIADILATFGVPGMPIVKAGVDVWNLINKRDEDKNKIVGTPNVTNQRPINVGQQKRISKPLPPIPKAKKKS